MVEVPEEPALIVTDVGLAVSEKSCTVKVTVAAWESDPPVPVMLT
jgi:hypothetical protein